MTIVDYAIIAIPLLAGFLILIRFLDWAVRFRLVPMLAKSMRDLHKKANRKLIEKEILRFPGIHMVDSLTAWWAGELTFLATAILLLFMQHDPLHALLSFFLGAIFGGIVFFLSSREAARNQVEAVRSTLPVASFMFSLMLEAGMGSSAALQEVVRALPKGPLASELQEISNSRMLGVSRAEAIERSRSRVPLDDYRAFLNLMQQGERLGIALSKGLRELSSRMMESQGHRAETHAQKAAVKLLFPLVIFIFPSVFLIILSPVILNLWELLGR